jgi:protein-S-isoprenylcysteine O-methyltransferase Ste14
MLQDVLDYDKAKAALELDEDELIPSEVIYAILDGGNPIKIWHEYRGMSQQAEREYSPGRRLIALIIEGILFVGILPGALVYFSPLLDHQFELPRLAYGAVNVIIGYVFIVSGILFALWSIYVQFTIGRGTPAPVMATQKLIIQKPYSYCRNPMALGTIVLYLGVAALIGSISAVVLVLIWTVLLLIYIKFLEEKEMEMRFGEAYQEYRKQTPFIIPRIQQRKYIAAPSEYRFSQCYKLIALSGSCKVIRKK